MTWLQDGGHGGSDPGAVSNGNIEKNYTLEASLYVDQRLAELGIKSDVSRTKDVSLNENDRVALARKYEKGNSHHFNAGGGSGVEVIHSIYSDGKYEHMLIEEFRKAGYPVRPRPVFFKTLKNGQNDYYYMHRRTGSCRMTIIEYDFVDGPQAEKIKDKSYREGMYECVVRAICRDEGVTYKAPGTKEGKKVTEKYYTSTEPIARLGDKGDTVRLIHYFLAVTGHTRWANRENDTFTSTTENAVRSFQKEQRIGYENGIVDYNTFVAFARVMAVYREHWVESYK